MKVISVVSTKGGSGKSTIAVNIATQLAENNKVLLVDADKEQETSLSFCKIRNENPELVDLSAIAIPYKSFFKDIKNYSNFDYIVIDAGAGNTELLRTAILCGTYGVIIIPTQPTTNDIWGAGDTAEIIESCRTIIDLNECYLLLNRVSPNKRAIITKEAEEALNELSQDYNIGMLNSKLYERQAYQKSISHGMNVIEYTKIKKDNGKAAEELKQLVQEILKILKE